MRLKNSFQYLFFSAIVLVSSVSYAQDKKESRRKSKKVNEQELIRYSSMSSVESSIDKAKGWALQNNGAWYSMNNEIPLPDQKSNTNNYGARTLGQDNFTKIELRKLMIGNKQYSVLIIMYRDGQYDFPVLKEGWQSYASLDYYVFDSKKLFEILPNTTEFNKSYAVNLNVFARGTIKNYRHKNWKSILVGNVQQIHLGEKVNGWDLIFAVYPIKNNNQEVCRFRLIKSFDNAYLNSMYTAPNNADKLFDRSFYEVAYYSFKNFIGAAQNAFIPVQASTGNVSDPYQNNFNWGILKYQIGDYISAVNYFEKALDIRPNAKDFMLFSYLGNAQSKLHRYNDAIASYDRALQLRPDDVLDYSNWVRNFFNRGVTKYYMNDVKGACSDWRKALEMGFGTAHDYIQQYCKDVDKEKDDN